MIIATNKHTGQTEALPPEISALLISHRRQAVGVKPSGDPSPLPPLHVQAVNFAAALGRSGLRLITGKKNLRSESGQAACLSICQACPEWIPERQRCAKCGCFAKWKARLAGESCPLGKWPAD